MASWKKVLISGSQIDVAGITSSLALAATSVGTGKVVILDGSEFKYTSSAAIGGGGTTTATLTRGEGLSGANFNGSVGTTFAVSSSDLEATIDISGNGIKVKDGGIGTTQIATSLGTLGQNQFTGSFKGDGSGLTNVTASRLANPLIGTAGTGVNSFTYNGTSQIAIEVSGAAQLTNNTIIKWNDTIGKFEDSLITEGTNALTLGDSNTDVSIPGDLNVAGTASFNNAKSLLVKDQYILLNSGSNSGVTAGDGGIVVQSQGSQNIGELLGFQSSTGRWGITGSFNAGTIDTFTPKAYMGVVINGTDNTPGSNTTANDAAFKKSGNIYIDTDATDAEGGVWIYV